MPTAPATHTATKVAIILCFTIRLRKRYADWAMPRLETTKPRNDTRASIVSSGVWLNAEIKGAANHSTPYSATLMRNENHSTAL